MKMQGTGNDYLFFDNFDGAITDPESLCVRLCRSHYGVGADGIVLIGASEAADARMRIYNRDGTEGRMAGNCIRCVAKFLYDSGRVTAEEMTIETASGVKRLRVYTRDGRVTSADVDMGRAVLDAAAVPCTLPYARAIGVPAVIGGREYAVTCVSMGNPHCVVFTDSVDALDLDNLGPQFENAPVFPERVNTEFVRVVNRTTLKMRCYERGNGETMACGTGACAAVVAAVENGLCEKDTDVNVYVKGGLLVVRYADEGVTLAGNAELVFEGVVEV